MIKAQSLWIRYIITISRVILSTSIILTCLNIRIIIEWPIAYLNSSIISFNIYLDPINSFFGFLVTFITANILKFSKFYMHGNINLERFTHLVIIFVLSMNILIFFPNLIFIILGWDGLGIRRFLLVIYYHNPKSLKRGLITAFTNRIGDVLILLAFAFISTQGQWSYLFFWERDDEILFITLILAAAFTKRAQGPFTAWLPQAIAAPTPVSALVHSSTLVTAGVFLIIQFKDLIYSESRITLSVILVGIIGAFSGASTATIHIDPKKIVAFSTLRHLGLIVTIIGLGYPNVAFFHLITHATFKSLLFVGVGIAISIKHHKQNLQRLKLVSRNPRVRVRFIISLLSINALPGIAGFYSKEIVLELSLTEIDDSWGEWLRILVPIALLGSAYLSIIYSIRLWRGNVIAPNPPKRFPILQKSHFYIDKALSTPVALLSIASITRGSVAQWILFSEPLAPVIPILDHHVVSKTTIMAIAITLTFCSLLKINWNAIRAWINILVGAIWKYPLVTKPSPWYSKSAAGFYSIYNRKTSVTPVWPVYKIPRKSFTTARALYWGRWASSTSNLGDFLNYKLSKAIFKLRGVIIIYLENGWLKFFGPSKTINALSFNSSKLIPNKPKIFNNLSIIIIPIILVTLIIL